jgi:hypothetical protein
MKGLWLRFQFEIDTPPKTDSFWTWLSLCLGCGFALCSPASPHLDVQFDRQTLRSVDHLPLIHSKNPEVVLRGVLLEVLLEVLLLLMQGRVAR